VQHDSNSVLAMATARIEYTVFLGLTDQFNMYVWFQRSEVAVRKAHRADRLITILRSSATGRIMLEKLPSIKDRGQTDRGAIVANCNSNLSF